MSKDTQEIQAIASVVVQASTPTPVLDSTRRVSIGPVARKLAKRKRTSRRWLPRFLLASAVVACGAVVFGAIKHFEETNTALSPLIPILGGDAAPVIAKNTIEKDSNSPVRSVIELVGAFEDLKSQEADDQNPLDLPKEDSPTTRVAVYTPSVASHSETDNFLNQINMGRPKNNNVASAVRSNRRQLEKQQEEQELADVSPNETNQIDDAAVTETTEDVAASIASPSAETTPEADEQLEVSESTAPTVSEVSSTEINSQTASDLLDHHEPEQELADAGLENPASKARALPPTIESETPKVLPQESTTDAEEIALAVTDGAMEEEDALIAAEAVVVTPVTEPATPQESSEVESALAEYATALSKFKDSPEDRSVARSYYTTLSDLAQISHDKDSAKGMKAIHDVYSDAALFDLASSAASSWIKWSKRTSSGVVVAGKVESVTDDANGVRVGIRTTDRRSSIVSVFIVHDEQNAASLSSHVGEELAFAGIVTDEQLNGSPMVVGRLLLTQ